MAGLYGLERRGCPDARDMLNGSSWSSLRALGFRQGILVFGNRILERSGRKANHATVLVQGEGPRDAACWWTSPPLRVA